MEFRDSLLAIGICFVNAGIAGIFFKESSLWSIAIVMFGVIAMIAAYFVSGSILTRNRRIVFWSAISLLLIYGNWQMINCGGWRC